MAAKERKLTWYEWNPDYPKYDDCCGPCGANNDAKRAERQRASANPHQQQQLAIVAHGKGGNDGDDDGGKGGKGKPVGGKGKDGGNGGKGQGVPPPPPWAMTFIAGVTGEVRSLKDQMAHRSQDLGRQVAALQDAHDAQSDRMHQLEAQNEDLRNELAALKRRAWW